MISVFDFVINCCPVTRPGSGDRRACVISVFDFVNERVLGPDLTQVFFRLTGMLRVFSTAFLSRVFSN